MKKISTLIILLMALGFVTKAQNFNNIIKELRDTSWRTGGNFSNVNIRDNYKYNRCIDMGDFVIVGERDSHNLKQGVIIQIDGTGAFEQMLLPNMEEQKNYMAPNHYDFDQNVIIASTSNSIAYKTNKPYIIDKNKNGNWVFKKYIEVNEKNNPGKFGSSVAIEGDIIVIGAFMDNTDAVGENKLRYTGSAFIYEKIGDEWEFKQKITAKERGKDDYFGFTVDIKENEIIVGAPKNNDDTGAAYIFNKNKEGIWEETQKIVASTAVSNDYAGYAKFVNGEIFVSAPEKDKRSGGLYVFKKQDDGVWKETQFILPRGIESKDVFGKELIISSNEDYLFVGAPLKNGEKTNSGAVYVFKKKADGNWFNVKTLEHENPKYNQQFGKCLLVKDNLLFIGYNELEVNSVLRVIKFQE